jgi:hypothetical protein
MLLIYCIKNHCTWENYVFLTLGFGSDQTKDVPNTQVVRPLILNFTTISENLVHVKSETRRGLA